MRHADHTRDDATPGQIIGFIATLVILAIELAAIAVAMLIGAAS